MGTTISGDTGVVFPDATTQSTAVTVATPFSINASAGAGAQLRLPEATANGVNYVAVKAADALAGNVTFTLPTADGTNGQFLQTNGAGQLAFATPASASTPFSIIGDATAGAEIRLPEDTDNGSNYVALKAPNSLASNLTFTLPTVDGTNGQYLQTNGSGQLAFATVPTTSPAGSTGQIQINNAGSFGAVASGTAGQYLTSGGAGSPPTWATAPAQALTLIASGTLASPASEILVNNLVTTGYSAVIIELLQIKFVSSSNTYLRFVAPGGTTSSGLFYTGVAFTKSSPNGMNTNNINGANDLYLMYMNNSSGVMSANINVFSPNLSTTYRQLYVNSGGYDGSAGQNYWAGGYHNGSSFGGFRLYGDGVNLDTGASYRVYGVI